MSAEIVDLRADAKAAAPSQAPPPAPLVPPEVDLRSYNFMPLKLERLRRSRAWLAAKRRPELGFYMMNLWAFSWHEIPAASLENDDDLLADAAMCSPERWDQVKDAVLRGWVLCSDGRLYHPVVAELAIEAWEGKWDRPDRQEERSERARCAAEKRWGKTRKSPHDKSPDNTTTCDAPEAPADPPPMLPACSSNAQALQTHCSSNAMRGEGQGEGQGQESLPLGFSDEKPSGGGRAREAPQRAVAAPLPPDFVIPEDWVEEARQRRSAAAKPEIDLARQAERFVLYHPAQGTRCVDWHAKWLLWAADDPPHAAATTGPPGAAPAEKPPPGDPPGPVVHVLGEGGDRLAERLGPTIFRQWFSAAQLAIDADGSMVFAVENRFIRDWVRTNYAAEIDAAYGRRWRIEVQPRRRETPPVPAAPALETAPCPA